MVRRKRGQCGCKEYWSSIPPKWSFIDIIADLKISNNINKSLLGHSNLKETETYMGDFSTQETDDAMNTIFSYGDDPKAQLVGMINEMDIEQVNVLIEAVMKKRNDI